ncbi:hypothetical protein CEXT_676571 [Caerostris extrusa]|uniref:Uncharacterized protein n=1 Tax=Caerostris extrusa TaxID=172846 RepID=A0AAV4U3A4_CAEEX|nr:hypothetical protein CEXT_676571 [Caerostris extrusa]
MLESRGKRGVGECKLSHGRVESTSIRIYASVGVKQLQNIADYHAPSHPSIETEQGKGSKAKMGADWWLMEFIMFL